MKTISNDTPPDGEPTEFRRTKTSLMWGPMAEPFECFGDQGRTYGNPGDYVAKDKAGYYAVGAQFHAENFAPVTDSPAEVQ